MWDRRGEHVHGDAAGGAAAEKGVTMAAGRILVIDDEESMRHAVGRGIHRAGLTSVEVGTGKAGVDAFVAGGFDAVLTDMKLPDLNGLYIVSILTEMAPGVPVFVMTGYGTMITALDEILD